ncbi:TIGR02611 family protein [Actinomadura atramentaria]|uniref:TIGR02611 family protein n=1 Tax=Actinomadura atramentaria TaxID=1990 RepID=UPI0003674C87|nr:TIGR02611 family protein [Actinomadura atramentaria]
MATNQQNDAPAAVPEQGGEPGAMSRFRERIRRNPLLNTTWRIGVFTVGMTVLVGGLVMMVAPGPGILGIVVGLAILATEFAWAQRALHHARRAAEKAKEKALDPRTKRRNTVLAVLGGLVGGAAVIAYLVLYHFHLPWNIADWTPWS